MNNNELEIVKDYKYLGIFFCKSGSFLSTRKYLKEQATKAMFGLLKKCRRNNLSIECQIDLFKKLAEPVILYGSEIWGFENLDVLESIQLRFFKIILHLKQSTPNFIVYGELGIFPISIQIKIRMINFWCRLVRGNETKFSSLLYKLLHVYYTDYGYESKWLKFIKNILDDCGMSNVWQNQTVFSSLWISKCIEQKLKDQFIQFWYSEMFKSPKALCYRLFKTYFYFEIYISELSPYYMYILCKFRCGSHRLPVETGRWRNLPRSERVCSLCDSMDIGDEYHYIMTCSYFINERINLLPPFCHENVNIYKFEQLFASNNVIVLEKLCKFIKNVQEKVVPPG